MLRQLAVGGTSWVLLGGASEGPLGPWGHRFCNLKPSLAVLAAWKPDLRPHAARLRQSGSLPGASWKQF
eukprot:6141351-Pyramimonas_sp.AAC.1